MNRREKMKSVSGDGKWDAMTQHRERQLDDALAQSFPASDPPSICAPHDAVADPAGKASLDKGGISSILKAMSERSQFGRPQLHPASSTARL
jgi:hypothetical protein